MQNLKIKVCGMTSVENVGAIALHRPDYLGFIFYPRSLRYVGDDPDPVLFRTVEEGIQKVAVFVNEFPERMLEVSEKYDIKILQLHGMEAPETCYMLKKRGLTIVKVFPGDQLENHSLINEYSEVVDYLLFDTPTRNYGGSGRKFDWSKLHALDFGKPFFLSGGIAPDDTENIKAIDNSFFHAVDINSRFETSPGIKDASAIGAFIKELKNE